MIEEIKFSDTFNLTLNKKASPCSVNKYDLSNFYQGNKIFQEFAEKFAATNYEKLPEGFLGNNAGCYAMLFWNIADIHRTTSLAMQMLEEADNYEETLHNEISDLKREINTLKQQKFMEEKKEKCKLCGELINCILVNGKMDLVSDDPYCGVMLVSDDDPTENKVDWLYYDDEEEK